MAEGNGNGNTPWYARISLAAIDLVKSIGAIATIAMAMSIMACLAGYFFLKDFDRIAANLEELMPEIRTTITTQANETEQRAAQWKIIEQFQRDENVDREEERKRERNQAEEQLQVTEMQCIAMAKMARTDPDKCRVERNRAETFANGQ